MVRKSLVSVGLVGVDPGSLGSAFSHESPQGHSLDIPDYLSVDQIGVSVLDPDNCDLTGASPTCQGGSLGLMHVLSLAPNPYLINFYRAVEYHLLIGEALPEPVNHEPGRLVTDLQVAVELHGGYTLQAGGP